MGPGIYETCEMKIIRSMHYQFVKKVDLFPNELQLLMSKSFPTIPSESIIVHFCSECLLVVQVSCTFDSSKHLKSVNLLQVSLGGYRLVHNCPHFPVTGSINTRVVPPRHTLSIYSGPNVKNMAYGRFASQQRN